MPKVVSGAVDLWDIQGTVGICCDVDDMQTDSRRLSRCVWSFWLAAIALCSAAGILMDFVGRDGVYGDVNDILTKNFRRRDHSQTNLLSL